MATYPSFYMVRSDTSHGIDGGFKTARATNGALRVQRLFPQPKREFNITHWLTAADKSTLDSFYSTNKDLNVDLVWPEDNVTYTVRFAEHPQLELRAPDFWIVKVKMLEV